MAVEISKNYDLKMTVTQDGTTITNPISGNITKTPKKATTCNLTFSNKNGLMTHFLPWNAVIKVYLGLDAVEDTPIFTGIPFTKKGRETMTYSFTDLFGYLKRHKDLKLDDFTNFDGMEAGQSINEIIGGADYTAFGTSLSTDGVLGTNPVVTIDDTLRFPNYTDRDSVIRSINTRCWDTSGYPDEPEPYILYMLDNVLHQEKQTRLADATSIHTIASADNLLTSDPVWTIMGNINKQVVMGDAYEDAYGRKRRYENIATDSSAIGRIGVVCGTPTTNKYLTNNGDCLSEGERNIEANKGELVRASIGTVGMFNIIPGRDYITVTDSKYGLEGTHRVSEVKYTIGDNHSTKITLDNTRPLITEFTK